MSELLNEIGAILSYNEYTEKQVITMMNYLIQEGNATNPMEFITEIAKKSEKYEGTLMTMAQALRQEGRQEGIQEGIQKGKAESARTIARQLLANGVDRAIVKMSTGLSDAEMNALMGRVNSAKN
ncbi:hypothetical protein BJP41_04030 [Candidatus Williamhamiltonella defendens]|uniref:Transposase n=2 Tax=Candidatus Williamhamiltonella defendens TaxID=138072 RepID=C4K5G0_HAMD5|nr:transposase [Candidatus Hamiltonella defensa]ACQ67803.1 putative transposase [Candidatus Hamiltonella defensa 5AT (Acyrthosiphon pisum)]ATW22473.1 hypothetical protein BJP44_05085 [Candidatus Hamiltonella defensa]ATW29654.1 hypothetical protein BJP41_04030 [Candidatus Hamiltonella defensa]ATW31631.1 hypothetical protein BJP42_04105 [Candidatus Hamiltonella defensa]